MHYVNGVPLDQPVPPVLGLVTPGQTLLFRHHFTLESFESSL
jgi:hypothetical protein